MNNVLFNDNFGYFKSFETDTKPIYVKKEKDAFMFDANDYDSHETCLNVQEQLQNVTNQKFIKILINDRFKQVVFVKNEGFLISKTCKIEDLDNEEDYGFTDNIEEANFYYCSFLAENTSFVLCNKCKLNNEVINVKIEENKK